MSPPSATQKCHPPATKVTGKRFSKNKQTRDRFFGQIVDHKPWFLSGVDTRRFLLFFEDPNAELRQSTAFV